MTHWNSSEEVLRWPPQCLGFNCNALWEFKRSTFFLSETKSCKSCSVCQWLWQTSVSPLYGVLTKTLHTAQAHFGVWHASAKHKNKLTENTKTALYPRGPFERNENQRNPEFPLFHSAFLWPKFRGRPGEQYRLSVCLTLVLFIKHLDGLRSGYKDARRPSLSPFPRSSVVG